MFYDQAHGLGILSKCEAQLDYCLVLGPLFWKCSHPNGLSYTHEAWVSSICQYTLFCVGMRLFAMKWLLGFLFGHIYDTNTKFIIL